MPAKRTPWLAMHVFGDGTPRPLLDKSSPLFKTFLHRLGEVQSKLGAASFLELDGQKLIAIVSFTPAEVVAKTMARQRGRADKARLREHGQKALLERYFEMFTCGGHREWLM